MGRDAPWLPPGHCIVPGPKVQAGRPDSHPKNPTSRQLRYGLWCSQNSPSSPSPSPYRRSLYPRGSALRGSSLLQLFGWARQHGAESQCSPLWTATGERGVRWHVRKMARQILRTPLAKRFLDSCALDIARPEDPPNPLNHGVFMGFSKGFHVVFMGFSWGFHGVPPGGLIMYEFLLKISILGGPRVPQGHRPV